VQQRAAEAAKPVVQTQASGSQTGQVQVTEAKAAEIRKIFVCPKCGAENEMEDKFCYKCGFRFTKPKKKAEKAPAKKAKPRSKVTADVSKTKKQVSKPMIISAGSRKKT
jgi:ribosomal protein L40E